jgi:hypothetical protein
LSLVLLGIIQRGTGECIIETTSANVHYLQKAPFHLLLLLPLLLLLTCLLPAAAQLGWCAGGNCGLLRAVRKPAAGHSATFSVCLTATSMLYLR